jgi:hypothetical protein
VLGAPAALAPELVDALAGACRSQPSIRAAYATLRGSELTIGLVLDAAAAEQEVVQSLGQSADEQIGGGTLSSSSSRPRGPRTSKPLSRPSTFAETLEEAERLRHLVDSRCTGFATAARQARPTGTGG